MSEQNYKVIWDESLNQIHEEYKSKGQEAEFNLWFNMEYVEDTMNVITVNVPSDFMWTTMVSKGYVSAVEHKITELCGINVTLQYIVKKKSSPSQPVIQPPAPQETTKTEEVKDIPVQQEEKDIPEEEKSAQKNFKKHPDLNEDLTFEKFVYGENSEFAYSASLAAAKNPGKAFNPLLIYGGTGLGKTHLMQSIGNYIYNHSEKEDIKISYVSAENFTNDFTKSIRENTMEKFKNKYRKLDVLLLDDIHFLIDKDSTQEELFHTFEALFQRHAQMVFTCDRPLSELKGITDRLRSRFSLGTPIDLQPPSYETRKAILQKKLASRNETISDEVLDYIARNVQSNVRELEGCLTKLLGYAELLQKPLNLEIAKKQLSDSISQANDGTITIDIIQKVVANHYNISLSDIKSTKRNKKIVIPRQIAIFISRKLTEYSYPEIGEEFGGQHHTSIMYSFEKVEDWLKTDSNLNSTVELLIKEIKEYKTK